MKPAAHLLILLSVLGFGPAANAVAQTPDSLLLQIREAYQQLDYELAEQRAAAALTYYDRLTNAQLVEIHTTLGLTNYAQNELEASRKQFESALALSPNLTLDPLLVSPKILEFFEQIKLEARVDWSEQPTQPAPPSIRYVQIVDTRAAASMRSLVLPGWGQLYKEQPVKGWAFMGAWGLATAGAVVSAIERERVEDALQNPDGGDPDELEDRYDAWGGRQRNFIIGAAGVWLYSYLDALLVNTALPRFYAAKGLYVSPRVGAVELGYRTTF